MWWKMCIGLHVKYPLLFFSDFNETLRFPKNTQTSIFMKIRSVRTELFHADGRTYMTELIVAFHSFVIAPKNCP